MPLSAHQLQPECRHTVNERIMQEQFLSTREKLNYNLLEVHFRSNLKSSKCYTVAGIKFMFFFGHRLFFYSFSRLCV